MKDLLLEVVSYLIKEGFAEEDGVDIFRDFEPEQPADILIIHEYAGDAQALQGDLIHRSLQVSVRSASPVTAKEKVYNIYHKLSPKDRFLKLTEDTWCQIYPRETPFRIKIDDSGRHYFGFNLGITTNKEVM